jgi:hypothetical protein
MQSHDEHDSRNAIRQHRRHQQSRSREVLHDGSSSDGDDSSAQSDDGSSGDDDTDSNTSVDTNIHIEREQRGATTVNYMADACRLFPWKDD